MKIHCKYDELVDPATLIPHTKNPHVHSLEGARALLKQYEYNGIRQPITVSLLSGSIVAGHKRRMAAMLGEMKEFPVVYQHFDSSDHEYAYLCADNGLQEWSEIDKGIINEELPNLGIGDLELLGLKDFDLDPPEQTPKPKKPKFCPHCGENVNEPPQV